jgi:chaperonin GroES
MIKPLFDQVQIEVKKAETMTSSGIILTQKDDQKLEQATVLAIGPDVEWLKVGDEILFKAYSSDTIELNGVELSFVKEENVLATI